MRGVQLGLALIAGVAIAGCAVHSRERTASAEPMGPGALFYGGATTMARWTGAPRRAAPQAEVAAFEATDCIVYFDVDSAQIRPDQEGKLDVCGQYFASHPEENLKLAGYADERGDDEYNDQLAERRAEAVMHELIQRGVRRDQLEIKSYGEDHPAVRGEDEVAWSRNRRVEFVTT